MKKRTPIRTCVACREQRHAQALLRLRIDAEGTLDFADPGPRPGGRSAWVCPTATCIRRVQSKPGMTRRSLRDPFQRVAPLLDHAREDAEARLAAALVAAHRAGLVRHGHAQRSRLEPGRARARLVAAGRPVDDTTEALPWPADLVGRLLGRGPRATVELLPGIPTEGVLRELRHLRALG